MSYFQWTQSNSATQSGRDDDRIRK